MGAHSAAGMALALAALAVAAGAGAGPSGAGGDGDETVLGQLAAARSVAAAAGDLAGLRSAHDPDRGVREWR